jgi:SAM-dependent methyltransferase
MPVARAAVGQTSGVTDDPAGRWNRRAPDLGEHAPDVVHYGPDIPTEAELRLLGTLAGKRVLELGCGTGQTAVAMARQGAHVIGVDPSMEQLAVARRWCEREHVKVELHQGDLADLAFIRADSIDLTFSSYAVGFVSDLNRVFRQVHRVLKQGCPLVFSIPHPTYDLIDDDDPNEPLLVRRSYFDRSPLDEWDESPSAGYHHTVSDVFMGLVRSNFRVDVLLEPESVGVDPSPYWREAFLWLPRTLIVRARKEGI